MTPVEREDATRHEERASKLANEIVECFGIVAPPVDPFDIAASEAPRLHIIGDDFRDRFDGQLEYHRTKNRFLLFYNTKLDSLVDRHPRTRFSVAHELGHFYIPEHRELLMRGKGAHPSHTEFSTHWMIERQADAFAASLLMPRRLMRKANRKPLTAPIIRNLAKTFQVSLVSMAIMAVKTSDFPCAVVAYRQGWPAWQFHSPALAEGKCFPKPKSSIGTPKAQQRWLAFANGSSGSATADSKAESWFKLCGRALERDPWVTEHYIESREMATLLVLLTIEERDLFDLQEDD